jgi:signal transduction histidine kinase
LQAQQVLITNEVDAALRKQCSICASYYPAYDSSLMLNPTNDPALPYFHNSHILLKAGRLEEADLFAQLTLVAIGKDTLNNLLYKDEAFLRAKIAHLKNNNSAAIAQYKHFLVIQPPDSVLAADAILSVAQLYMDTQNWLQAETYLINWNRYYLRFTSDKTRNNLYDSVAYLFREQKIITRPDAATQMGINFFTEQKDTSRLILFYFRAADWYVPQSIKKALIYAERGLTLASYSKNLEQQKEGYLKISLLEERRSEYKAALQYRKQYEKVQEQIRIRNERLERRKGMRSPYSGTESPQKKPLLKLKRPLIFISILLALLFIYFILVSIKVIKNSRSVSQLRNEVERLEELNNSKIELFSIISHDLRSAVHTLQINTARLKTILSQFMNSTAIEVAGHTERLISTLQSLLNNLLYWALSQIGQTTYHPEPIALQPLINGICYDLQPLADAKHIALFYTLNEPFFCTGDVNSVKIIFRNLIDNAIKYTPDNGSVVVSARQEAGFCLITIQDTGIGMSPDIIQTLFTSDSRRIQQDASGRRSTGIGLWLAKKLTEQNGGNLKIESGEGVGTRITISLPVTG